MRQVIAEHVLGERDQLSLDVTVAICTRDRAAPLGRLLESLCSLAIPAGKTWEVIVVDNGSSDATGEVIRGFVDRLPLRSVYEPSLGLTRARNRAIRDARGRYICWTDDDVLLSPQWLAAYCDAFDRHPEAALFGGPIEPLLEAPVRRLFDRGKDRWPLAGPYARRSPGPTVRPLALQDCDVPYGANFAVRAAEQRRFLFDERLGPSPLFNRLADELDVIYRLMKDGAKGWWVPDAHVLHLIPPERQTLRYLLFYYRRIGETVAWLHDNMPGDNINEINGPPHFAMPASPAQLRRQLVRLWRTIIRRTCLRQDGWLGVLALYGYGVGLLRHWHASRAEQATASARPLQVERQ